MYNCILNICKRLVYIVKIQTIDISMKNDLQELINSVIYNIKYGIINWDIKWCTHKLQSQQDCLSKYWSKNARRKTNDEFNY